MKNKKIVLASLIVLCLTFSACGGRVIETESISNISESDLDGVQYLAVYEVAPSEDGRYCIDCYTSTDADSVSYILPLSDDFYGETQTFEVVGARSVTQYFSGKEFYEEWWKNGVKNNEFVYNTRFSYKVNELGEISYLSEYDYYADTDITGSNLDSNDDNGNSNDDFDDDTGLDDDTSLDDDTDFDDDMSFDDEDDILG